MVGEQWREPGRDDREAPCRPAACPNAAEAGRGGDDPAVESATELGRCGGIQSVAEDGDESAEGMSGEEEACSSVWEEAWGLEEEAGPSDSTMP